MSGELVVSAAPGHTWQGRGRQVIATARSADMFHGQFEKEFLFVFLLCVGLSWPLLFLFRQMLGRQMTKDPNDP